MIITSDACIPTRALPALRPQLHEDIERPHGVAGSSDRAFGVVFAVGFGAWALLPLLHGRGVRGWALAVAALFLAAALALPRVLAPLNWAWTHLGMLLALITNPIILAVLFYLVLMPVGLLMRLVGRRPLQLGFDPRARSYWTPREPGPAPESMKREF
ncbi:MAG TPA: SxtJ family membrane protein [Longimicrobium sp.]|jgi:hypothetical protein